MKILAFLLVVCISGVLQAQPYVDIVSLRGTNSPDAGLFNRDKNPVVLNYRSINTNFPLKIGKGQSRLLISPFAEKWLVKSPTQNDSSQSYYGIAVPLSLRMNLTDKKWEIQATLITRMNGESIAMDTKIQFGGFFLLSYKPTENITYKLGVYMNDELFGLFVLPLAGIDWKINNRTNLFGLIPGNLNFEYKLKTRFYTGFILRTITNSYADVKTSYWRVNENQFGAYLDSYLSKNIVLNLEAGHSVLRKLRSGDYDMKSPYDWSVNDAYYIKLMLAYRLRLR